MPTKDTITIRPARLADLHAMNRVKTGASLDMIGARSAIFRRRTLWNPKRHYNSFNYWRGAMVAEVNGQVVGVAQTHDTKLSDLWVVGSMRSQGIGAKLVRAAERRLRQQGYRVAHLFTAVFNGRGRVFYERNGWTLAGFTQHRVCHFRRCVYVKRL